MYSQTPFAKIEAQTTIEAVDAVVDEICNARINGIGNKYYCEKCSKIRQMQRCDRCVITKVANDHKRNLEFWGSRYADFR